MSVEQEEWRAVVGWEGYDVSATGWVRSWRRCGPDMSLATSPRLLRQTLSTSGYPYVSLCFHRPIKRMVHLLVLTAFVGPCPDGMEACHGMEGAACPALRNLRWDTRSANNGKDKHEQGTATFGERGTNVRLTSAQVRELRLRARAGGVTQEALARDYGVIRQHVSEILLRRVWRYQDEDIPPIGLRGAARLTPDDAAAIRTRFAAGESGKDLASAFGVGRNHVYNIASGKFWSTT